MSADRLAGLQASFSDFKLIKSRSVAQLICEIDITQADHALAILGGIPQPGKEVPVAIARLVEQPVQRVHGVKNGDRSEAGKLAYQMKDEMERAATRCALLCKEPLFWDYMSSHGEAGCAEKVRVYLGVKSRGEIVRNIRAFNDFIKLELAFAQASGRFAKVDNR